MFNETWCIEHLVLVLKSDWSSWSDISELLTVCGTLLYSVWFKQTFCQSVHQFWGFYSDYKLTPVGGFKWLYLWVIHLIHSEMLIHLGTKFTLYIGELLTHVFNWLVQKKLINSGLTQLIVFMGESLNLRMKESTLYEGVIESVIQWVCSKTLINSALKQLTFFSREPLNHSNDLFKNCD